MRYAQETEVSSEKSRSEIEKTLVRFGATSFMYGHHEGSAVIEFVANNKRIRFVMKLPPRTEERFTHFIHGRSHKPVPRTAQAMEKVYEQEVRQHWRALALLVKAKLAAVEAGITTFETEFLAHIVIPTKGGRTATVSQVLLPQVDEAYQSGRVPPLLLEAKEE